MTKTKCKGDHDKTNPSCCECGGMVNFYSEGETWDYSEDIENPEIEHVTCQKCLEKFRQDNCECEDCNTKYNEEVSA